MPMVRRATPIGIEPCSSVAFVVMVGFVGKAVICRATRQGVTVVRTCRYRNRCAIVCRLNEGQTAII